MCATWSNYGDAGGNAPISGIICLSSSSSDVKLLGDACNAEWLLITGACCNTSYCRQTSCVCHAMSYWCCCICLPSFRATAKTFKSKQQPRMSLRRQWLNAYSGVCIRLSGKANPKTVFLSLFWVPPLFVFVITCLLQVALIIQITMRGQQHWWGHCPLPWIQS